MSSDDQTSPTDSTAPQRLMPLTEEAAETLEAETKSMDIAVDSPLPRAPFESTLQPRSVKTSGVLVAQMTYGERYDEERVLGQGAMGAVTLCLDRQIGRRVALKTMHPKRAERLENRKRFVREARIQGQIEHPALVPVYDLGIDPKGGIYFIMKRVRGVTLEDILDSLAKEDSGFVEEYSQQRLLRAFGQICLAVDYAHQHGVLHRDLKPSNIMLGDFGEVYILDWGLAGIDPRKQRDDGYEEDQFSGESPQTIAGVMFGTPGYASPEQVRGELTELGPGTDVYALGAILFEILCLARLHPRRSVTEVLASTLSGALARPSIRAPEKAVPPELEEIIVQATEINLDERYRTARELHDDLEGFLDGQRDVERRHALAEAHASEAAALIASGRAPSFEARRSAMKEIGRALTLDPENQEALGVLQRLVTEPPRELPDEVREELAVRDTDRLRWIGKLAYLTYGGLLLYLPLLILSGVRDWTPVLVFFVLSLTSAIISIVESRLESPKLFLMDLAMLLSNLGMAATAWFFGPLLVTPAIITINTTPYALYLRGAHRWFAIGTALTLIVGLIFIYWTGHFPVTYQFTGGTFIISAGALSFEALPMWVLLSAIAVGHVLTNTVIISRMQADLQAAEEQMLLHTWHLRGLAPDKGATMLKEARGG